MKPPRIARDARGAALVLAVIAAGVLAIIGGAFAMIIQNEARNVSRATAYDQALYVAESGIEDVLYQRSKNQSDPCFPYTDDGTLSGAAGEFNAAASSANCDTDPATDADTSDTDSDFIQCWPYDEKLYANTLLYGPHFECHDGSDAANCPTYSPLAVWPAGPGGGPGWKDADGSKPTPLASASQSSGLRYTTGFFTLCNDNFVGDDLSVEPAKSAACLSPPCARRVFRFSIVSVGSVETRPGENLTRAVKVDIVSPILYAGVIDKYVDRTLMYDTTINGAIHINGWWDASATPPGYFSMALPVNTETPPLVVSVSYPEDPNYPDLPWPNIVMVHLPVRIDIPDVNWSQFENQMDRLYKDASDLYGSGKAHLLKREDYDPANIFSTIGNGTRDFNCGATGQADMCRCGSHSSLTTGQDICNDSDFPQYCESGSATDQSCCTRGSGPNRIHNCSRYSRQVWSDVAFDLFDFNTGGPAAGFESPKIPDGGGLGPRDGSLKPFPATIFDPSLGGPGCSFSNPFACLTRTINRPEFVFMGRHEFAGRVFIDGIMGIGTRTPYHTCGPGDGPLDIYCVEVPQLGVCPLCIPNFAFGVPHWHIGNAKISGEMLVNGKLYMADYVKIDGGALYANDHIIKDDSSALDLTLHIDTLLCSILGWVTGGAVPGWACSLVMTLLQPIIAPIFPWWPVIDLTNNELIDFGTYLDIDGWNTANVINSGTIYTRGDFRLESKPGFDMTTFLLNQTLSLLGLGFLDFTTAYDPVRIWNYGAIIAGGTESAPGFYRDGNVFLGEESRYDLLTYDPDKEENSTGYVFARGSLQVTSDIISHYSGGGVIDSCSFFGYDPDCAASGIFYSGGIAAASGDTNMFTSEGGRLDWNGPEKDYKVTCLNAAEPTFWNDIVGNVTCWARKMPLLCSVFGNCEVSEFNIRGYIFAGQVGGLPMGRLRLDQDTSVIHPAITRKYYRNISGIPVDWMEVNTPANLKNLAP